MNPLYVLNSSTLWLFFREQLETVKMESFTDDVPLLTVLLSFGYKPFFPNVISPTDTEYNLANFCFFALQREILGS